MACSSNNTPFSYTMFFTQQNCPECNDTECGGGYGNARCILYTGAELPCTGIQTTDSLEVALQKIEEQVCSIAGDYSTYNTYCLAPINTQQEFVESISSGYCNLLSDFNDFIQDTFPDYQADVDQRITDIINPGLPCAALSLTNTSTLTDWLQALCDKVTETDENLDISAVDWNQCMTVISPPSTLTQAFQVLVDQICSIGAISLPVFNNLGTCLPSPTGSDTLVQTVEKIKTRLCQTPTFDINALTWGCITQPSVTTTNIQDTIQTILDYVNDYIENKLTFSADFNITQTNPSSVCDGKTVELVTPIVNSDRLVAATALDGTPGTLADKLMEGAGITLDYSTPGKVVIIADSSTETYRVKADASDASPNFLISKVNGVENTVDGIAISESYNAGTGQVDLTPAIDWSAFVNKWFDAVNADAVLKIRFCTLVQGCIDENYVCHYYRVSLTPDQISASAAAQFSYTDCNNQVQIVNLSAPSLEYVDICALKNSVTAIGLLVIDYGLCNDGTTSTTTTTTSTSTSTTTTTTAAPASSSFTGGFEVDNSGSSVGNAAVSSNNSHTFPEVVGPGATSPTIAVTGSEVSPGSMIISILPAGGGSTVTLVNMSSFNATNATVNHSGSGTGTFQVSITPNVYGTPVVISGGISVEIGPIP